MVMKKLHSILMLSCIIFGSATFADDSVIQPQSQGDITFVSGGIGIDEREALDATRANYNLSLLFSEQSGDYLSDVKVRITDVSGNTVLDTVANGPKLFAKLKHGSYTVTVEAKGQEFHKTVTVKNTQQPAVSFVWH
jgi:hypothetical protein